MTDVICVGGGEHARVVMDACRTMPGIRLLGFTDPLPCIETQQRLGVSRLATDDEESFLQDAIARGVRVVLGIGCRPGVPDPRPPLVRGLRVPDDAFLAVTHSHAWVSPAASVAPGVVIMAGAVVQPCAAIAAFALINSCAVIEHDVSVGAWAVVGPRAAIGGRATIGTRAFVGLGACVRDHVHVGDGAVVGMGAVVVSDVKPAVTVRGVPARP